MWPCGHWNCIAHSLKNNKLTGFFFSRKKTKLWWILPKRWYFSTPLTLEWHISSDEKEQINRMYPSRKFLLNNELDCSDTLVALCQRGRVSIPICHCFCWSYWYSNLRVVRGNHFGCSAMICWRHVLSVSLFIYEEKICQFYLAMKPDLHGVVNRQKVPALHAAVVCKLFFSCFFPETLRLQVVRKSRLEMKCSISVYGLWFSLASVNLFTTKIWQLWRSSLASRNCFPLCAFRK